jgi:hypothetical protein
VTNQAPRSPIITPIKGLEIANQSGIASRKDSESRLRKRQRMCLCVVVITIFVGLVLDLIMRPVDLVPLKKVRAAQPGATRKIRTSDNHHWA